MEKEQFLFILTKYLEDNASPEEENFLYAYYKMFLADMDVMSLLQDKEKERLKLSIKSNIDEYLDQPVRQVRKIIAWPRITAAASIFLVLSAGGYFLLHKHQPRQQVAQNQTHDIAPGQNQATLTLANGQKIALTKGLNGKLAQQGNTTIQVSNGLAIDYTQGTAETKVRYNTLSTAKGEMSPYPLVLPDGSKVILNTASSITFPTSFLGKNRTVKITGEAYFEVVHNAAKPFRVTVKDQTIEDIGTSFDINAYADEPSIRTTLLEGSIKVSAYGIDKTLTPGQQSQVQSSAVSVKDNADIEVVTAWKNGFFQYKHTEVKTMMRQFARWYDVEVVYKGNVPNKTITGKVYRNVNASQALKILTYLNIHYRIEGKKIIITS